MTKTTICLSTIVTVLSCVCASSFAANDVDVPTLVRVVNSVGPKGQGHRTAIEACQQLVTIDAQQLPQVLVGMDESGPLSRNWLRAVVESIAQRQLDAGQDLPQNALEAFLADTSHAPHARRLAYELILQVDSDAEQRLVPTLLDDPSLELRRDAVVKSLAEAKRLLDAGSKDGAISVYRRSFDAARDLDQVNQAADALKELGETVDMPAHFGFIMQWKLIAPFDNTDKGGFDVAYGPEKDLDPTRQYEGKEGVVEWIDHTSDEPYGVVDLNQVLGKFKGAIAYAYHEFDAEEAREVEVRLGCINANKIWLNGELLTANHVYHSGSYIDQYSATGRLLKGKNTVLLKIAQNEQTESWAQRWQFQLRICDAYGTAVLSRGRASSAATAIRPTSTRR